MNTAFLGRNGSIQSEASANTSILIKEKNTCILTDVSGAPVQILNKLSVDPVKLDAVILTHSHIDHLYALPSLLHNLWLMKRKEPLLIEGNEETLTAAKALCAVFGLEQKKNFFGVEWKSTEFEKIGNLEFCFFPTKHNVPTRGFICQSENEKLTYVPDTRPFILPEEAYNSDILIHEATGLECRKDTLFQNGHTCSADAARCADSIHAGILYLVHLPPEADICLTMEKEAQKIFPASYIPELCCWIQREK